MDNMPEREDKRLPQIDLEPHQFRREADKPKRRTFWQWLLGDAEQLAHEKKMWGTIGVGVIMGLAFWWVRAHH
jgi:hypothetical protein